MQEQVNISTTDDTEDAVSALQNELTKWQNRVPKLALALRERTQELDAAKTQLEQLAAGDSAGTGIQARDALIGELEAKLKAQTSKHQDAQGQMHARDVEITQLREEVSQWREKWQSVTESLDAHAGEIAGKDADQNDLRVEVDGLRQVNSEQGGRVKEQELELTALRESTQSLESRNQKLFETTEMANNQIESLGENLSQLREQAKEKDERLATLARDSDQNTGELSKLAEQVKSRDQDIEFLHNHVAEKQTEINTLNEKLAGLENLGVQHDELTSRLGELQNRYDVQADELTQLTDRLALLGEAQDACKQLEEQLAEKAQSLAAADTKNAEMLERSAELEKALSVERDEIKRLEECVVSADSVTGKRETERRQLSEQFAELKARNQHLESQLAERSNLVVGLEQEKTEISSKTSSLEEENVRLSKSLEKSQRHAGEHAEHITQLDSRLERQQDLMQKLETEFAQVQEEYAQATKAHGKELEQKAAVIAVRDEELAAIRQEFESGSSSVADYEERVSTLKSDLKKASGELAVKAQEAKSVAREYAQHRSKHDAARTALTEKLESLEKQLRKQTKATAQAETTESSARADLKTLKAEYKNDSSAEEYRLLQQEAQKLESMVQERTEQLNEIKWQQEMSTQPHGDSGDKMLVVLNQQLAAARSDNERLLEQIRTLEGHSEGGSKTAGSVTSTSNAPASIDPSVDDDLSQIRGVGPKLVAQLKELGIDRFDQIACLNAADLDDAAHVLHPFKKRIERDDWISQAAVLANAR